MHPRHLRQLHLLLFGCGKNKTFLVPKTSILTDMQGLYLLPYSFANTVTEHQNSVHGCFPLLWLNVEFWDGNQCVTDGLSKCLPSSEHSFLKTSLSLLQANNTFSRPSKKKKRSSDSPFRQPVMFLSRNPLQKYVITNLPRIVYLLDSKTIIYLKNHLS